MLVSTHFYVQNGYQELGMWESSDNKKNIDYVDYINFIKRNVTFFLIPQLFVNLMIQNRIIGFGLYDISNLNKIIWCTSCGRHTLE